MAGVRATSRREGAAALLAGVDGILVPGGFGDRGFEGKVLTAQYAREHGMPYFGICYGMQAAVVDFARHVAGLAGANSTENDRKPPHPVIGLITEWRTADAARSSAAARTPTWAAPCAWACRSSGSSRARWRTSCTARTWSASAIAIATSSTTATAPSSRTPAW